MKHYSCGFRWALGYFLIVIGIIASASPSHAKCIRPYRDITSEDFWVNTNVEIVCVTDVTYGDNQVRKLTATVMGQVTPEVLPTVGVATVFSGLIFLDWDPITEKQRIVLKPGDLLLVYRRRYDNSRESLGLSYVTRLARRMNSDIAKTLIAIAAIRNRNNETTLLISGSFDKDKRIAGYCLKQFLNWPIIQASVGDQDKFLNRLLVQRDDESVDALIRVLSSQLANRIKTGDAVQGDEYEWLKRSFVSSNQLNYYQLDCFAEELINVPQKRKETITFLLNLLLNPGTRQDIRISAYGNLAQAPLFVCERPEDPLNQVIFAGYIRLLKAKEPMMRMAAASWLKTICRGINSSPQAPSVTRQAKSALTEAVRNETDPIATSRISRILSEMNDPRFFAQ